MYVGNSHATKALTALRHIFTVPRNTSSSALAADLEKITHQRRFFHALLSAIAIVCLAALVMFVGSKLGLGMSPEEFGDMVKNQFGLYGGPGSLHQPAYPSGPIVAP